MSTLREVLVAAKALIDDPKHWTVGTYARDACGNSVNEMSSKACKFCSMGAVYRAAKTAYGFTGMAQPALAVLGATVAELNETRHQSVSHFNDTHTHEKVMELFDKAIGIADEVAL